VAAFGGANPEMQVRRLKLLRLGHGMSPFQLHSREGVEWLESLALSGVDWLVHAFSTRLAAGTDAFDLAMPEGPGAAKLLANRKKFAEALGATHFQLAEIRQVHSCRVIEICGTEAWIMELPARLFPHSIATPRKRPGDALITRQSGVLLAVRTADCVPVLLADINKRAVAAVHAGWRGTLSRITEKTVGEMRRVYGSQPQDLLAAVGPSIGACCYPVGPEVVDAFAGAFVDADEFIGRPRATAGGAQDEQPAFLSRFPPGHGPGPESAFRLDLAAAVRQQLMAAGVPQRNISVSGICTSCQNDRFFSYRKEGSRAGRMMAVIGILPA
jgi:YfiH family protein